MARRLVGLLASTRPAIPSDNQGQWYLARSKKTVAMLEQAFQEGQVGAVLYERIGGLLQGPRPYLYVQVRHVRSEITHDHGRTLVRDVPQKEAEWPEWTVMVCLTELGISLMRPLTLTDVLSAPRQ